MMTEDPQSKQAEARMERAGDEIIGSLERANYVLFEVKGVGRYKADRLTGRMQMRIYKDRVDILRDEMGFTGHISDCPRDAILAAEAIATLKAVNIEPVEEYKPLWNGEVLDLPEDVILGLYNAYYDSKKLVEFNDDKAKADAKNSSGGSAG